MTQKKGAYLLYLSVRRSLTLHVGMLGSSQFPKGLYIYVGSASKGVEQRIARHRRLAAHKGGIIHWHIDFLLAHPQVQLIGDLALEQNTECAVSKDIASRRGIMVPVPGFGSTDCIAGCRAHLYRFYGGSFRGHRASETRMHLSKY